MPEDPFGSMKINLFESAPAKAEPARKEPPKPEPGKKEQPKSGVLLPRVADVKAGKPAEPAPKPAIAHYFWKPASVLGGARMKKRNEPRLLSLGAFLSKTSSHLYRVERHSDTSPRGS